MNAAPFQHAIAEGLNECDDYLVEAAQVLRQKRDLLAAGLESAGFRVLPSRGTFFLTTDIAPLTDEDGYAFCRALPERCGIVAIPSSVFYDDQDAGADPWCDRLLITWVDAFSAVAFGGNPAAVCLLREPLDDGRMQSIAFELGIAEDGIPHADRRPTVRPCAWFARGRGRSVRPRHPGIGARCARRASSTGRRPSPSTLARSGPLRAAFDGDLIELDFPADPVVPGPLPAALAEQWPGTVVFSGSTSNGFFTFVVLAQLEAVRDYQPDLAAIAATGAKALLLTHVRPGRLLATGSAGGAGSGADYVLARLRAQRGHRRGPGHRLGPVRGRPLLGSGAGA